MRPSPSDLLCAHLRVDNALADPAQDFEQELPAHGPAQGDPRTLVRCVSSFKGPCATGAHALGLGQVVQDERLRAAQGQVREAVARVLSGVVALDALQLEQRVLCLRVVSPRPQSQSARRRLMYALIVFLRYGPRSGGCRARA